MERRSFLSLTSLAAAVPTALVKGKRRIDTRDDPVALVRAEALKSPRPNLFLMVAGVDLSPWVSEVEVEQGVEIDEAATFESKWETWRVSSPPTLTVTVELRGLDGVERLAPVAHAVRSGEPTSIEYGRREGRWEHIDIRIVQCSFDADHTGLIGARFVAKATGAPRLISPRQT